MEAANYHATVILTVLQAEVYHSVNNVTTLIENAPLNILYLSEINTFFVQVRSFTYSLSKEIPVLASPPKAGEAYPAYVFPNLDGFYIIKIVKVSSFETLSAFETILSNHCDLAYRQDEPTTPNEDEIEGLIELRGDDEHKEAEKMTKTSKTKTEIASGIITKGGELTRKGLISSAEVLSKGLNKLGNFVQNKYIKKKKEVDVNESTVTKLKVANTATEAAYTFTKVQAQAVLTIGKEIGKEVGKKLQKTDAGKKFDTYKHKETVIEIGKSTVHAAACIYDGMAEALTILGKGISSTTTDIVNHKYGEKAASATKQGFDAVGNLGKVTKVYQTEAAKFIAGPVTEKKAP